MVLFIVAYLTNAICFRFLFECYCRHLDAVVDDLALRLAGKSSAIRTTMVATIRRSLPSGKPCPELGFGVMSLNSGSFSKLADMDVVPFR